jgi:hypothetical protein
MSRTFLGLSQFTRYSGFSQREFEVISYLEEFEVIETILVSFESSSDSFHLSPNIDKGFRLSGSRDPRIISLTNKALIWKILLL